MTNNLDETCIAAEKECNNLRDELANLYEKYIVVIHERNEIIERLIEIGTYQLYIEI